MAGFSQGFDHVCTNVNILHRTTDPSLLQRLKEMLGNSAHADIAVGYFFMSGFEQARSV